MISETALTTAVERGVVTAEQVATLHEIEGELASASALEPRDEERLRFVSGFGDIFVTLGLALFLTALGYFGMAFGFSGKWAITALAAWGLAEFFTRKRRMALPSIVLLVIFAYAVFTAVFLAFFPLELAARASVFNLAYIHPLALAAAGVAGAAAACLHYLRFRVPITPAAGAAAFIAACVGAMGAATPELFETLVRPALFVCGVIVFILAMRFDISDPERLTRRTDIAFWLHLLAAPLIVHSLVSGLSEGIQPTPAMAWAILGLFLVLGLVAVLVNRRAILVSGLAYAGFAFTELIRQSGVSDIAAPLTLLALGSFVLVLSAGWQWLRRTLLSVMPASLTRHLPSSGIAAS